MDSHEMNKELHAELSAMRMAMGQLICNTERNIGDLSLPRIARRWIDQCRLMSRSEWIVATKGLIHFLKSLDSKQAAIAAKMLEQPENLYDIHSNFLRGYLNRKGKNKNAGTYSRSLELIQAEFKVTEHEDAQPQTPQCDKGDISILSRIVGAWKAMLEGVKKWI